MPSEDRVIDRNGRERRKAVFTDKLEDVVGSEEEEDEEEESDEEEEDSEADHADSGSDNGSDEESGPTAKPVKKRKLVFVLSFSFLSQI